MSKRLRDPRRDKDLSLQKDCRNSYGESPHAARKAIPKRKRIAHKQSRTAAKQDLDRYEQFDPERQDQVESSARLDTHSVGSWKKMPDEPLGVMVERAQQIRARKDGKITDDEYHDLPCPSRFGPV